MKLQIMSPGQGPVTMSSREIADLVEKRHDNVKRTIDTLAERGVIASPQSQEKATAGRPATEYRLEKRDTLVVVAQLSPEFTGRIVDRWQELEAERHGFDQTAILESPAALRRGRPPDAHPRTKQARTALEDQAPEPQLHGRNLRPAYRRRQEKARGTNLPAMIMAGLLGKALLEVVVI